MLLAKNIISRGDMGTYWLFESPRDFEIHNCWCIILFCSSGPFGDFKPWFPWVRDMFQPLGSKA